MVKLRASIDRLGYRECFSNEMFIKRKTEDDLWVEFVNCWVSVYIGFPEIIRFDR